MKHYWLKIGRMFGQALFFFPTSLQKSFRCSLREHLVPYWLKEIQWYPHAVSNSNIMLPRCAQICRAVVFLVKIFILCASKHNYAWKTNALEISVLHILCIIHYQLFSIKHVQIKRSGEGLIVLYIFFPLIQGWWLHHIFIHRKVMHLFHLWVKTRTRMPQIWRLFSLVSLIFRDAIY